MRAAVAIALAAALPCAALGLPGGRSKATRAGTATPAPAPGDHGRRVMGPPVAVGTGDSYASGQGSGGPYGSTYDSGCDRAPTAPVEAMAGDGLQPINIACSGASVLNVIRDDYKGEPPQALQLAMLAFTHNVVAVTLTAGGNDFSFSDIVAGCAKAWLSSSVSAPRYCAGDVLPAMQAGREQVTAGIAGSIEAIRVAMSQAGYDPGTYRIIVSTYPDPIADPADVPYPEGGFSRLLEPAAGCPMWNRDMLAMRGQMLPIVNGAVNDAIAAARLHGPVDLVDNSNAFRGHELCNGGGSWVHPIRTGFEPRQDRQDSMHPTAQGQQALGDCLAQVYERPAGQDFTCEPGSGGRSQSPHMVVTAHPPPPPPHGAAQRGGAKRVRALVPQSARLKLAALTRSAAGVGPTTPGTSAGAGVDVGNTSGASGASGPTGVDGAQTGATGPGALTGRTSHAPPKPPAAGPRASRTSPGGGGTRQPPTSYVVFSKCADASSGCAGTDREFSLQIPAAQEVVQGSVTTYLGDGILHVPRDATTGRSETTFAGLQVAASVDSANPAASHLALQFTAPWQDAFGIQGLTVVAAQVSSASYDPATHQWSLAIAGLPQLSSGLASQWGIVGSPIAQLKADLSPNAPAVAVEVGTQVQAQPAMYPLALAQVSGGIAQALPAGHASIEYAPAGGFGDAPGDWLRFNGLGALDGSGVFAYDPLRHHLSGTAGASRLILPEVARMKDATIDLDATAGAIGHLVISGKVWFLGALGDATLTLNGGSFTVTAHGDHVASGYSDAAVKIVPSSMTRKFGAMSVSGWNVDTTIQPGSAARGTATLHDLHSSLGPVSIEHGTAVMSNTAGDHLTFDGMVKVALPGKTAQQPPQINATATFDYSGATNDIVLHVTGSATLTVLGQDVPLTIGATATAHLDGGTIDLDLQLAGSLRLARPGSILANAQVTGDAHITGQLSYVNPVHGHADLTGHLQVGGDGIQIAGTVVAHLDGDLIAGEDTPLSAVRVTLLAGSNATLTLDQYTVSVDASGTLTVDFDTGRIYIDNINFSGHAAQVVTVTSGHISGPINGGTHGGGRMNIHIDAHLLVALLAGGGTTRIETDVSGQYTGGDELVLTSNGGSLQIAGSAPGSFSSAEFKLNLATSTASVRLAGVSVQFGTHTIVRVTRGLINIVLNYSELPINPRIDVSGDVSIGYRLAGKSVDVDVPAEGNYVNGTLSLHLVAGRTGVINLAWADAPIAINSGELTVVTTQSHASWRLGLGGTVSLAHHQVQLDNGVVTGTSDYGGSGGALITLQATGDVRVNTGSGDTRWTADAPVTASVLSDGKLQLDAQNGHGHATLPGTNDVSFNLSHGRLKIDTDNQNVEVDMFADVNARLGNSPLIVRGIAITGDIHYRGAIEALFTVTVQHAHMDYATAAGVHLIADAAGGATISVRAGVIVVNFSGEATLTLTYPGFTATVAIAAGGVVAVDLVRTLLAVNMHFVAGADLRLVGHGPDIGLLLWDATLTGRANYGQLLGGSQGGGLGSGATVVRGPRGPIIVTRPRGPRRSPVSLRFIGRATITADNPARTLRTRVDTNATVSFDGSMFRGQFTGNGSLGFTSGGQRDFGGSPGGGGGLLGGGSLSPPTASASVALSTAGGFAMNLVGVVTLNATFAAGAQLAWLGVGSGGVFVTNGHVGGQISFPLDLRGSSTTRPRGFGRAGTPVRPRRGGGRGTGGSTVIGGTASRPVRIALTTNGDVSARAFTSNGQGTTSIGLHFAGTFTGTVFTFGVVANGSLQYVSPRLIVQPVGLQARGQLSWAPVAGVVGVNGLLFSGGAAFQYRGVGGALASLTNGRVDGTEVISTGQIDLAFGGSMGVSAANPDGTITTEVTTDVYGRFDGAQFALRIVGAGLFNIITQTATIPGDLAVDGLIGWNLTTLRLTFAVPFAGDLSLLANSISASLGLSHGFLGGYIDQSPTQIQLQLSGLAGLSAGILPNRIIRIEANATVAGIFDGTTARFVIQATDVARFKYNTDAIQSSARIDGGGTVAWFPAAQLVQLAMHVASSGKFTIAGLGRSTIRLWNTDLNGTVWYAPPQAQVSLAMSTNLKAVASVPDPQGARVEIKAQATGTFSLGVPGVVDGVDVAIARGGIFKVDYAKPPDVRFSGSVALTAGANLSYAIATGVLSLRNFRFASQQGRPAELVLANLLGARAKLANGTFDGTMTFGRGPAMVALTFGATLDARALMAIGDFAGEAGLNATVTGTFTMNPGDPIFRFTIGQGSKFIYPNGAGVVKQAAIQAGGTVEWNLNSGVVQFNVTGAGNATLKIVKQSTLDVKVPTFTANGYFQYRAGGQCANPVCVHIAFGGAAVVNAKAITGTREGVMDVRAALQNTDSTFDYHNPAVENGDPVLRLVLAGGTFRLSTLKLSGGLWVHDITGDVAIQAGADFSTNFAQRLISVTGIQFNGTLTMGVPGNAMDVQMRNARMSGTIAYPAGQAARVELNFVGGAEVVANKRSPSITMDFKADTVIGTFYMNVPAVHGGAMVLDVRLNGQGDLKYGYGSGARAFLWEGPLAATGQIVMNLSKYVAHVHDLHLASVGTPPRPVRLTLAALGKWKAVAWNFTMNGKIDYSGLFGSIKLKLTNGNFVARKRFLDWLPVARQIRAQNATLEFDMDAFRGARWTNNLGPAATSTWSVVLDFGPRTSGTHHVQSVSTPLADGGFYNLDLEQMIANVHLVQQSGAVVDLGELNRGDASSHGAANVELRDTSWDGTVDFGGDADAVVDLTTIGNLRVRPVTADGRVRSAFATHYTGTTDDDTSTLNVRGAFPYQVGNTVFNLHPVGSVVLELGQQAVHHDLHTDPLAGVDPDQVHLDDLTTLDGSLSFDGDLRWSDIDNTLATQLSGHATLNHDSSAYYDGTFGLSGISARITPAPASSLDLGFGGHAQLMETAGPPEGHWLATDPALETAVPMHGDWKWDEGDIATRAVGEIGLHLIPGTTHDYVDPQTHKNHGSLSRLDLGLQQPLLDIAYGSGTATASLSSQASHETICRQTGSDLNGRVRWPTLPSLLCREPGFDSNYLRLFPGDGNGLPLRLNGLSQQTTLHEAATNPPTGTYVNLNVEEGPNSSCTSDSWLAGTQCVFGLVGGSLDAGNPGLGLSHNLTGVGGNETWHAAAAPTIAIAGTAAHDHLDVSLSDIGDPLTFDDIPNQRFTWDTTGIEVLDDYGQGHDDYDGTGVDEQQATTDFEFDYRPPVGDAGICGGFADAVDEWSRDWDGAGGPGACPPGGAGPAGPRGPAGETGPAGAEGPQGPIGDTGPEGARGPQGDTGPAGPTGDPGEVGATGEPGPQGQRGVVGDIGLRGDTGDTGASGARGPTGQAGAVGPTGDAGVTGPQGEAGPTGDAGPRGVQGPTGDQGPRGDEGPRGSEGLVGPTGPTGPTGPVGPTGEAGPVGHIGPSGPRGDTGDTGTRGDLGAEGLAGPRGPTGATGSAGARGEAGPQGPLGDTGPEGPTGPTGDKGPPGICESGQSQNVPCTVFVGVTGPTGEIGVIHTQVVEGAIQSFVSTTSGLAARYPQTGDTATATATCPGNSVAVSGGGEVNGEPRDPLALVSSQSNGSNQWKVVGEALGALHDNPSVKAYVICEESHD